MFNPNPGGACKTLAEMTNGDLIARLIAFTIIGLAMIAVGVAKIVMSHEAYFQAFCVAYIGFTTSAVVWAYFSYSGELLSRNRRAES
jgi:hypothetical protein